MISYFARPIDFCNGAADEDVISSLKAVVASKGFAIFDPADAWTNGVASHSTQLVNIQALHASAVVFAYWPSDTKSIGVPIEIGIAHANGIPVVCVTDGPNLKSVALGHAVDLLVDMRDAESQHAIADFLSGVENRNAKIATWQPMPDGRAPKIGKEGDAGFDLYFESESPLTIEPGARANVPSKVGVQLPDGMWCLLLGRSSSFQRGLLVAPSVIDAGYRGELFACVWNFGGATVKIEPGERIAQIVPMPLLSSNIEWIRGNLSESQRGTTGFGSTGR